MTGESLARAIAAAWSRIAPALEAALPEFETELTRLLRELEQTADSGATIEAILTLFDRHPQVRDILRESLLRTGALPTKGAAAAAIGDRVRYLSVPVFFGTSRALTGESEPARRFGAERAENSFGLLHVSIPDDHRMGQLEKPSWFRLQFTADPEKHVLLLSVESLERAQFVARARSGLASVQKKEVLLFIHGYNVTFEDAARRAAQVAYDLHFEGLPTLYSWPSEGSMAQYLVDSNNATWAEPHFRDFLRLVREDLGADAVHVIAHSMGSRLLANTIAGQEPGAQAAGGRLQQIVFAAPDIDADTFRTLSAAFTAKAARVTLYASSGDRALEWSERFQKYARAGQSGPNLMLVPQIDTIDASSVKTEFFGHSYFGDADSVLSDLFYLIRNGTSPGERAGLRERRRYGSTYWEFSR